MSLAGVRVVLVQPSHPGNIGAVARAMKNMCLQSLYLVDPKVFPSSEATAPTTKAGKLQVRENPTPAATLEITTTASACAVAW